MQMQNNDDKRIAQDNAENIAAAAAERQIQDSDKDNHIKQSVSGGGSSDIAGENRAGAALSAIESAVAAEEKYAGKAADNQADKTEENKNGQTAAPAAEAAVSAAAESQLQGQKQARTEILLEAQNITREYRQKSGFFGEENVTRALKGVSFALKRGKTLAIVGESGCGKSTLARILTLIDAPTSGQLLIEGDPVSIVKQSVPPDLRRKVQMVFQNPYASLNPRQKIGSILEEPLLLNTKMSGRERRQAVVDMLEKVGLAAGLYNRYPHMFSGGQRQRIAIARALMLRPKLLILDEPVSALDLSVQAQVLNLLADLQDEFCLTYVFISHDLSVVRYIADDILVMCFGEVAEYGNCENVFRSPQHNYTKRLFYAQPHTDIASIRARTEAKRSSAQAQITA